MRWTKSSFSTPNNDCVEIAQDGRQVHVRNSKTPERGPLALPSAAVADFVAACRAGDFDDLGA